MYSDVMMFTACKLLDLLVETAGFLYKKVCLNLLEDASVFEMFTTLLKYDIKIME